MYGAFERARQKIHAKIDRKGVAQPTLGEGSPLRKTSSLGGRLPVRCGIPLSTTRRDAIRTESIAGGGYQTGDDRCCICEW
jgi:hypothetical protein